MADSQRDILPAWITVAGSPAAPPVLLVSGLGGTAAFWAQVQSRLASSHHVMSYDQPGCGQRPAQDGPVTISALAQDAASVLESALGDRPVTVIGHSTGGAIAQTLAAARPDLVKALVLSGTWLRADAYMHALFGFRTALLRQAPDLSEGLTTLLTRDPADIDADSLGPHPMTPSSAAIAMTRIDALLAFDGALLAHRNPVRTLVLGARDDRIVPAPLQAMLHEALPCSTLQMLPDGGHFFPMTRPHEFVQRVADWQARLAALSPRGTTQTDGDTR